MSHECALKLTALWNISLQLFDLNYKFEVVGASLWALAKSIYYPAFKMSNHLSCKPKGTLGKVVDEESTSVAHTGPIYAVNNMKVFSDLVTWREGKYTATTLRKKILSISQRIKILTDRKILLRTSLYAGYMESTIDIQRDAVFQSLHGLHSTYFSRA